MHFVYVLKSKLNKQLYIGSTKDLRRRVEDHNAGKEFSTKRYLPWTLFYYEAYREEISARMREKRLKHHGNAMHELKKGAGLPSTTFSNRKSGAGFTLLEVIVAVFVVMVGIGGSYAFLQQSTIDSRGVKNELVAAYLAQEGLEIIRNIRDTNFLDISKGVPGVIWSDGLTGCAAGCEADYTTDGDTNPLELFGSGRFLNIISGELYSYGAGTASIYKRRIIVDDSSGPDKLEVEVQVEWQERGITKSKAAATELYNWLGL